MKVIKRSGVEVEFDSTKIYDAIRKANKTVPATERISSITINDIVSVVAKMCKDKEGDLGVEDIQDMVETQLILHGYSQVAKNYIKYRYKRALVRKSNSTDDQILSLIACTNEDVKQENSNKNPTIASVQRDYMAGEVSKDISRRLLLPPNIVDAHDKGIIHFHDMDYFINTIYNCCVFNLEDMLQNGTVISETGIDKPKSFSTACNIATQVIAQVASSQYGGQSISLAHLAPFVQVSRDKFRKEVMNEFNGAGIELDEEKIKTIVEKRVRNEVKKGIQTIQYQVITLMTTNGQAPFISVFMYINEVPEGQTRDDLAMMIEEMLNQRIQGVKNEKGVYITPAFPKLLYVTTENNIHEDSKYYYLTELAAKCSAKRLVPDYISEKKMIELKVDEKGEGHCYPCMGCVDGEETVIYKDNPPFGVNVTPIYKMWHNLKEKFEVKQQFPGNDDYLYMDLENIEIFDSKEGFVNVRRIIRNKTTEWVKVTLENGMGLICTPDHPFHTNNGRKRADALNNKDLVTVRIGMLKDFFVDKVEPVDNASEWSYDVTTDSDHFEVSGIYSHNCRSFLTPYIDPETDKPKYYGRFNQGVVTINLVDVACSSNGDEELFWKILDERLDLCKEALLCRHKRLLGTPSDVAPILWQHGAIARLKKGEVIDKLLFNGYSTISLGYAGLCECTRRMKGVSHTHENGYDFAINVMKKLNDACDKWKDEYNIAFSLYGTPLESTTYRFAKLLKKRFGVIEGVTDKNYITNSYHVHVTENIDAFSKLKIESEFQKLSPGGCISYAEVPNMQNNIPAVISLIQFIHNNTMYAEINTKSDYCMECGFDGEIQIVDEEDTGKLVWECPNCKNRDESKMNVARRTCGLTYGPR